MPLNMSPDTVIDGQSRHTVLENLFYISEQKYFPSNPNHTTKRSNSKPFCSPLGNNNGKSVNEI